MTEHWLEICGKCVKRLNVYNEWLAEEVVAFDPKLRCEHCWKRVSEVGQLSSVPKHLTETKRILERSW